MEPRSEQKRRFRIERLEERVAPSRTLMCGELALSSGGTIAF